MSVRVLLNLLNDMWKSDTMQCLPSTNIRFYLSYSIKNINCIFGILLSYAQHCYGRH